MPDLFIEDASAKPDSQALDELAKLRTLTDTLLECSTDGIVVLNRFGQVETLNQVAQSLLGCPLAEALGKSISDIFHAFDPDSGDPIDLSSERFRNPHLSSTRAIIEKPDGSRVTTTFQLKPNANPDKPELSFS